jgi:DNA invertase Pin-like site-specific DNA recombinase
MKYGYARVSTNEQDLANQLEQLKNAGAEKIYSEKYTGTKRDRPKLDELLSILSEGDELILFTRIPGGTRPIALRLSVLACLPRVIVLTRI